jgi:hypothetical protein
MEWLKNVIGIQNIMDLMCDIVAVGIVGIILFDNRKKRTK